ncbi:MAG: hypothetical protein K6U03_00015 [Firmicutes bacterium]|nr:hypothetical protein [Bacillota bacterium]
MKVYAKEPPEYLGWLHRILGNFKEAIRGTYHQVSEEHLQPTLTSRLSVSTGVSVPRNSSAGPWPAWMGRRSPMLS